MMTTELLNGISFPPKQKPIKSNTDGLLLKTLQTNVLYEQINKLLTNAAKIREIACVLRISTKLCINNLFNQQLITIIMNKSGSMLSLQMQELQKQLN
jgi:hypothetical protein